MHFKYIESCDEVGFIASHKDAPQIEYNLIAYVDGTVIHCSDVASWDKFMLKKKVPTPESKKAYVAYFENYSSLKSKAKEHFINKLKEYFSELSPAQFDLCWSKAWEKGHSNGYDEAASYLEECVELCQEFVLAQGKE
jgi:hypothetical protein